jgi:hypothetical protein
MQPRLLARTLLIAGIALLGAACDRGHAPTAPAAGPASDPAAQAPAESVAPVEAPAPTVTLVKPVGTNQGQLTAGDPVASCHIDTLSGGGQERQGGLLQLGRDQPFFAAGWVATPAEDAVPVTVSLRLLAEGSPGDIWEYVVPTGGDRTDVAEFKGKPVLATSGFTIDADTAGMPIGIYHAYLAFEHEGKAYSCNGGDKIVIE